MIYNSFLLPETPCSLCYSPYNSIDRFVGHFQFFTTINNIVSVFVPEHFCVLLWVYSLDKFLEMKLHFLNFIDSVQLSSKKTMSSFNLTIDVKHACILIPIAPGIYKQNILLIMNL